MFDAKGRSAPGVYRCVSYRAVMKLRNVANYFVCVWYVVFYSDDIRGIELKYILGRQWALEVDGADSGSCGVDAGDLLQNENVPTVSCSDWIHCQRYFCYFTALKVAKFMWPTLFYYEEGQFRRSTSLLYMASHFTFWTTRKIVTEFGMKGVPWEANRRCHLLQSVITRWPKWELVFRERH